MNFQQFRELVMSFPGVEEGIAYGTPIFKVKSKMLARLSEEFDDTIVIKIELPLRSTFLDGETFYITPHYEAHPLMLVALKTAGKDDLKYLVEQAWRMIAAKKMIKEFDESAGK